MGRVKPPLFKASTETGRKVEVCRGKTGPKHSGSVGECQTRLGSRGFGLTGTCARHSGISKVYDIDFWEKVAQIGTYIVTAAVSVSQLILAVRKGRPGSRRRPKRQ
jgi:hypothetical protein